MTPGKRPVFFCRRHPIFVLSRSVAAAAGSLRAPSSHSPLHLTDSPPRPPQKPGPSRGPAQTGAATVNYACLASHLPRCCLRKAWRITRVHQRPDGGIYIQMGMEGALTHPLCSLFLPPQSSRPLSAHFCRGKGKKVSMWRLLSLLHGGFLHQRGNYTLITPVERRGGGLLPLC